jgi:hypothetical protein
MALVVAVTAGAQTYPWNPDSNSDEFIGFTDILDILAVYGTQFLPENIFCNADSTTVIIDQGEMAAPLCLMTCKEMAGNCRVMNLSDAGYIWEEIVNEAMSTEYNQFGVWIQTGDNSDWLVSALLRQDNSSENGIYISTPPTATGSGFGVNNEQKCYCATHELPKVEYSHCRKSDNGSDPTDFKTCTEIKIEDGWYPLAGIASYVYNGTHYSGQAFWRWAE